MTEAPALKNDPTLSLASNSEFILYKQPNRAGFTLCTGRFEVLAAGAQFEAGIVLSSFAKDRQVVMQPDSTEVFATAGEAFQAHPRLLQPIQDDSAQADVSSIDYEERVEKGVKAILAGSMRKVVLARRQVLPMPPTDLATVPDRLAAANPNSFVHLLHSSEFGTWLGATPELLLHAGPDGLETMALAGTRRPSSTPFTGKEQEEHRIVADEIAQILKEEGFADVQVSRPDAHQAGSLTHLMSRIRVESPGGVPNHFRLANRLHPTSAVSGYPRQAAIDFIRTNEGFERSLYSGFIGVARQGQADYYVNLRCARLNSTEITLYAGAGIVPGSVPAEELAETETKMAVIKTAIEDNRE